MQIQKNGYLSLEQMTDQLRSGKTAMTAESGQKSSFGEILRQKSAEEEKAPLKFSRHATGRLQERNINLSQAQLDRLYEGTEKASQKGIKESLVLMDSLAFIVNIPNQTVVTAMDQTETAENIFTNIDGAVII